MTSPTHERVRPCTDLQAALDEELQVPGTRLHSIFPADAPRIATIEREGEWTRLDASPGAVAGEVARTAEPDVLVPGIQPDLVHVPFEDGPDAWTRGRAGMKYRDLIPGRLGGHVIASHIRIEEGGPVPDAVHHHAVRYQLIVCVRGWVRVVYEDQGEPFEMRAGDAVLQPPGIRHRVLESSPGLEVVEVACPAEHRTTIDHASTQRNLYKRSSMVMALIMSSKAYAPGLSTIPLICTVQGLIVKALAYWAGSSLPVPNS